MPEVLLYNIENKKAAGIKMLCSTLGIGYRIVDPADYGKPIKALLGMIDSAADKPDVAFCDEMLYLVDIRGDMLDIFLNLMRKRKLTVALKAVMTPTNVGFTSCELYRELCAEREAIRSGTTAHDAPQ